MACRRSSIALTLIATGVAALAPACSTTTGLPAATVSNKVDTVSLFALSDAAIQNPSAYLVQGGLRVRTDQSTIFDFAFDFDAAGRPVLLPTGAMHLGTLSGLQRSATAFDSIKIAPTGGYVFDSALVVGRDSVLLVRGRPLTCITGLSVSLYAKLQVLVVDTSSAGGGRRIDFKILSDQNCGYRGLEPGLPKQ
jgi:hypothetical protein